MKLYLTHTLLALISRSVDIVGTDIKICTSHTHTLLALISRSVDCMIFFVKSDVDSYIMKLPDIETFEERLRKAEEELGIKPENRVPVTYQRDE